MLRGSSAKADSLADTCRDLILVVDMPALLVAVSNEALADSGSLPYLRLLDPRSDPVEGPLSLSASSSHDEAVRVAVQIQTDRLHDSYQRESDEFLRTIDENIKRIIKEQVKGQVKEKVLRILPRIEQFVNAQLEAKVLTRSSHSSRTSYAVAADLSEMELKKILIEKMEGNKSIQRSDE
nr:hypothetical protein [Tanacetum cinerariifolium]